MLITFHYLLYPVWLCMWQIIKNLEPWTFNLEIKVPESGGREERHRIHVLEVQCEVSTVSDGLGCRHLLVLVHCVFWSPQSMQTSTRKFWSTSCFLLLTSFMEMLISFSSWTWHLPTLPKVPKAGSMTWCYCAWLASKLAWPEAHRESRWETPDPTMQMTWSPLSKQPGLHYTWAVSRADHLHAAPHWCSNSCKTRPNQVLSA